jgi:hypothetical protein
MDVDIYMTYSSTRFQFNKNNYIVQIHVQKIDLRTYNMYVMSSHSLNYKSFKISGWCKWHPIELSMTTKKGVNCYAIWTQGK